jgi:hypothetical protein
MQPHFDEGFMTTIKVAAVAAVAMMACAFVTAPAQADTRTYVTRDGRVITVSRGPIRLTVRPRSYLDPGTETLPLAQHYHDYAFSPYFSPALPYPVYGGVVGFWRTPLPSPVDLPSFYYGH